MEGQRFFFEVITLSKTIRTQGIYNGSIWAVAGPTPVGCKFRFLDWPTNYIGPVVREPNDDAAIED